MILDSLLLAPCFNGRFDEDVFASSNGGRVTVMCVREEGRESEGSARLVIGRGGNHSFRSATATGVGKKLVGGTEITSSLIKIESSGRLW